MCETGARRQALGTILAVRSPPEQRSGEIRGGGGGGGDGDYLRRVGGVRNIRIRVDALEFLKRCGDQVRALCEKLGIPSLCSRRNVLETKHKSEQIGYRPEKVAPACAPPSRTLSPYRW